MFIILKFKFLFDDTFFVFFPSLHHYCLNAANSPNSSFINTITFLIFFLGNSHSNSKFSIKSCFDNFSNAYINIFGFYVGYKAVCIHVILIFLHIFASRNYYQNSLITILVTSNVDRSKETDLLINICGYFSLLFLRNLSKKFFFDCMIIWF